MVKVGLSLLCMEKPLHDVLWLCLQFVWFYKTRDALIITIWFPRASILWNQERMMEPNNWLNKSKIFHVLVKTLLQIFTKSLLYFHGMINQLNLDQLAWNFFTLFLVLKSWYPTSFQE